MKSPRSDGFTDEAYKKKKDQSFSNSPHKIEEIRTLPNSFCEASIALISKPGKDIIRKIKL